MSTKSYIIWYIAEKKVQDIVKLPAPPPSGVRQTREAGGSVVGENSPNPRFNDAQKSMGSAHFTVHILTNPINAVQLTN